LNKEIAENILAKVLKQYATRNQDQLLLLQGSHENFEVIGDDGKTYQLEIQVVWDSRDRKQIRIIGAIDDGDLSSYFPMTNDAPITIT